MKKLFCVLSVVLLFLQSGGILMFYKVEQQMQQHRMRQLLETENSFLQQFTMSVYEFSRSNKKGKEILINGKMFDIKSYSISGNTVKLVAIHDKAEELIIKALKNVAKANSQGDNGLLVKIVKLLSLDYTLPMLLQDSVLWHPVQKTLLLLNHIINTRIADILTPPPESA
ncbi:MAG: hypothetical protein ACOYMF_16525 [Bacteroidales bacterium]